MKLAWIICNAIAVVATLVCASYLFYACRPVRNRVPVFSMLIAGAGLLAAVFMVIFRDGHGVGLLVGAAVASILGTQDLIFRSRQSPPRNA